MTDEQHIPEAFADLEPQDPLGVFATEPPVDEQGRANPRSQRLQGSFEVAWRLAH
jgi:hypothetical protein